MSSSRIQFLLPLFHFLFWWSNIFEKNPLPSPLHSPLLVCYSLLLNLGAPLLSSPTSSHSSSFRLLPGGATSFSEPFYVCVLGCACGGQRTRSATGPCLPTCLLFTVYGRLPGILVSASQLPAAAQGCGDTLLHWASCRLYGPECRSLCFPCKDFTTESPLCALTFLCRCHTDSCLLKFPDDVNFLAPFSSFSCFLNGISCLYLITSSCNLIPGSTPEYHPLLPWLLIACSHANPSHYFHSYCNKSRVFPKQLPMVWYTIAKTDDVACLSVSFPAWLYKGFLSFYSYYYDSFTRFLLGFYHEFSNLTLPKLMLTVSKVRVTGIYQIIRYY